MILSKRYFAIPLFVAAAMGIISGRSIDTPVVLYAFFGLSLFSLFLLFLLRARKQFAVLCVFFSLFSLYAYAQMQSIAVEERQVSVLGRVYGALRQNSPQKTSFLLDKLVIDGQAVGGCAYCTVRNQELSGMEISDGAQLSFTGKLYHAKKANSKYAFDFFFYLRQKRIDYSITSIKEISVLNVGESYPFADTAFRIRERIFALFSQNMEENNAHIAAALLFSHKSGWKQEDRVLFSKLGVAHIFAVSGMHISLIAALLSCLLKRSRAGKLLRLTLSTIVLLLYAYICGFSPATQRALIMFVMMGLASLLFRPYQSILALPAAGVIVLAINPLELYSASFVFSFSAMCGIILIGERLRNWMTRKISVRFLRGEDLPRFAESAIALFSTSFAAQVGVLLPMIQTFGQINLSALLFNLFLIPYVAILAPLLLLALLLSWIPLLGAVLASLGNAMISFLLFALKASYFVLPLKLAALSMLGVVLLLFCVLILLKGIIKIPFQRRVLFCVLMIGIYSLQVLLSQNPNPVYTQLSVGRADCAVAEDGNYCIVIDTGETGYELVNYLKAKNRSIDALFISHFDLDHYGGIFALMENEIPIKKAYIPVGALQSGEQARVAVNILQDYGAEINMLKKGDVLEYGRIRMEPLYPLYDAVLPNRPTNDTSLAMMLHILGSRLLTVGDLGYPYEHYAAAKCDILKVGHHGSKTSTREAFTAQLGADVALLSTNQSKGFPHENVMQVLANNHMDVYDTGLSGDIVLEFLQQQYKVIK